MRSHNLLLLWDIFEWNSDCSSSWKGWSIQCPSHLDNEKNMLIANIHGKSPVTRIAKDARGRGKKIGIYTTLAGYNFISNPRPTENADIWKSVWVVKILPKVDFFIWTLAHGNILTGDNMKKGVGRPYEMPSLSEQ